MTRPSLPLCGHRLAPPLRQGETRAVAPSAHDAAAPFPVAVFPAPLRQFMHEVAAALPCPPDFVGVPLLAVLGTAIGSSRVLEVKPGWREGPRLFTAVVADPGSKKSPALALVMQPLRERQQQLQTAAQHARPAEEGHDRRPISDRSSAAWSAAKPRLKWLRSRVSRPPSPWSTIFRPMPNECMRVSGAHGLISGRRRRSDGFRRMATCAPYEISNGIGLLASPGPHRRRNYCGIWWISERVNGESAGCPVGGRSGYLSCTLMPHRQGHRASDPTWGLSTAPGFTALPPHGERSTWPALRDTISRFRQHSPGIRAFRIGVHAEDVVPQAAIELNIPG
jgi:hypothetical protein